MREGTAAMVYIINKLAGCSVTYTDAILFIFMRLNDAHVKISLQGALLVFACLRDFPWID